jgi:hypothetical protein
MFERMAATYEADDQTTLNRNLDFLDWTMLSPRFFTVGMVTGGKRWEGEDVAIPRDILVHHANWTVGIDNKIRLLELVKRQCAKGNATSLSEVNG